MRALVLLIVVSAVMVGCGPTTKCGPGNCSGCCSATGQCETGNTTAACGTGGLLCGACSLGLNCNLGLCSTAGNSGGGSGGGAATGGGGGATGGGGGATGGGGGATGGGGGATGGGGGATGGGGGATGGGGGATGGGGGSGTAYDSWCQSYAINICDFGVRCGVYASATLCRDYFSAFTQCVTTPAIRDGRTIFDTSRAASCTNMLSSGSCDAVDLVAACYSVLRGSGSLNAACYGADNECEQNYFCDSSSTCPGICRPAPAIGQPTTGNCQAPGYPYNGVCAAPMPIGQSCAPGAGVFNDRQCVANAFCSAAKVCTAKRLSAQSCTASSFPECGGILQCSGGFCGPLASLSAPCDGTRPCKFGLTCGPSNVCVDTGTIGSPCTSPYGQCRPNLICDVPGGASSGTCQTVRTLGQSCSYNRYQCGFAFSPTATLYCTATPTMMSGVCAMKKGQGANCAGSEECSSGVCTNFICAGCVDPTP